LASMRMGPLFASEAGGALSYDATWQHRGTTHEREINTGGTGGRKETGAISGTVELGRPLRKVTDVKTDRSRRTVRLDPRVVAALRRHQVRQETRTQMLAGAKWRDTGLVFTTTYGTALGASNMVRSGWRGILKRAEVPYRPFHTSRHSAASFMIAAGVPIRTVMGQLGHSQMQMTSDLYTHLTAAMEVDAATRVADMLFSDRAQ